MCEKHAQELSLEIKNLVRDLPVITYSDSKCLFNNPVQDLYFGQCTGIGAWKGNDIAVVGTYHRNNAYYLLFAAVKGQTYTNEQTSMSQQLITRNGMRFKFMTYDDEYLRVIQLALIESELNQAVGRARTLREKATVKLVSNYPLRNETRFIW